MTIIKKQSTSENYIKYLDTAYELAKVNKVQVIENSEK